MVEKIQHIKHRLSGHSKVFENYFFMTLLQGASMLISLLMYPYLIRVLGSTAYGSYVFVNSNIQFFVMFISFGFSFPALKEISLHQDDPEIKNQTVSNVFTSKFYLFLISSVVLFILTLSVPFVRENKLLYIILFSNTLAEVLFPKWYFQGIQKMKLVTYINLGVRILTIPFIFIFIKSPDNLLLYAVIVSASILLGSLISILYLNIKENVVIRFVALKKLKTLFRDSRPFFWTSAFGTIKEEAVTLLIGTFFNMRDVAFYDLANKIVIIPRLITSSINAAIFPAVVKGLQTDKVKRIIRYESIIGLVVILCIVVFGYWAVLLLGGKDMLMSYPMAVILSITIYTWLVVGCYINYIFVPQNQYYFVTKNQLAALASFVIFALAGIFIYKSIFIILIAYSLSGIIEILYCKYLIKKYQLL